MFKRLHLSGIVKRKLKSQGIEKEISFPRISGFLNKDSSANDSSLSTTSMKSAPAETIDIVSKLFFLNHPIAQIK